MGTARLDEIAEDVPPGCVGCVLGVVAPGGVGGGVPLEDKRRRFKTSLRDAPQTSVV